MPLIVSKLQSYLAFGSCLPFANRSPFLSSRVTLLARPTSFQKILWLARPGQVGESKTIRAWVSKIGPEERGIWVGRVMLFRGTTFLHKKVALFAKLSLIKG